MKKFYIVFPALVLTIALILVTACKKEEPATKPSLSTTPVTNITTTTATSGGLISDDGGATITANGVCWGKTENPTIEGIKTTEGISTGQFVSNLTGLDAGTTYHARAYATNEVGTSYGADMTFLTLGQVPSGLTQLPSSVTYTSATLNGTVNPHDLSTTVTFEYGLTTSYGSTAEASPSPATGNEMVNVSAQISGLFPATTYHYRIKTVNSLGTTYSEDMTFTTPAIPPAATTADATDKTATGATLNGIVNANNSSTTVTFEYGATTAYGQTVTAIPSQVTGTTNTNVSAGITGLTAGTTYHFRVKAVNTAGTTYGSDMTFTTVGLAPTATTLAATNKTATGAKLNGSLNANNASTTVTFEYGLTASYGQTVTASPSPVTGNSNTNVGATITGLTAGTTYHFRVKAVNAVGTSYGSDMTFTTEGLAPTATTLDATNKTSTGATLNATVNANMVSTTVTFEYGTTTSYGQTITASPNPVTGSTNTNVSATITGLTAGTTYHFRVKAVNSVGTTYGVDKSFATLTLPPTNGLVGYWSFTGNANDESGYNHNGTVTGAVLTSNRMEASNSAYSFDGLSDYIYITNSSLVSGGYATISIWVKTDGLGTYYPIISGNQNDYNIFIEKDSVMLWIVTNKPTGSSPCTSFTTKYGYLPPNQWNHIVMTYDGTTLKMFINNILSKSSPATGQIWTPQSDYLAFGVYFLNGSPNATNTYKGKLDDVRIYNRALSTDEINALYHEGGW